MVARFTVTPRIGATAQSDSLDLSDDAVLRNTEWVHASAAGTAAELVEIDECRLTGVSMAQSQLPKLSVTDTTFATCDLAVLEAHDSTWTRVRVEDSRLSGIQLTGATCQHVEFDRAQATESLWRFATLRKVRFRDCVLTGADLVGARLEDVEFLGCDLTRTEFSQVRVTAARFVDCNFDGLGGIDALRRASIEFANPLDALGLVAPMAGALGITVTETESGGGAG